MPSPYLMGWDDGGVSHSCGGQGEVAAAVPAPADAASPVVMPMRGEPLQTILEGSEAGSAHDDLPDTHSCQGTTAGQTGLAAVLARAHSLGHAAPEIRPTGEEGDAASWKLQALRVAAPEHVATQAAAALHWWQAQWAGGSAWRLPPSAMHHERHLPRAAAVMALSLAKSGHMRRAAILLLNLPRAVQVSAGWMMTAPPPMHGAAHGLDRWRHHSPA